MLPFHNLLPVCLSLLAIAAPATAQDSQGPLGANIVTLPDGSPPIPNHPTWAVAMIVTQNPDDTLTGVVWLYRPGEAPVELTTERTTFTPNGPGNWTWTSAKGNSGTLKALSNSQFLSTGPNGERLLSPV
jgi:hypothetical protein